MFRYFFLIAICLFVTSCQSVPSSQSSLESSDDDSRTRLENLSKQKSVYQSQKSTLEDVHHLKQIQQQSNLRRAITEPGINR